MIFGRKPDVEYVKRVFNIEIDNTNLPIKNNVRNLGLIFDNTLRFSAHVSGCIQKAFIRLKFLYHMRHFLSRNVKSLLCNSLVLSLFNHCDTVYANCLNAIDKRRIQSVQNSCLRLIYGVRKYQHISHKLAESNWLNMEERRELHQACFFHKIIFLKCPTYLYKRIIFRTHVHNLNVRFRGKITISSNCNF